MSAPEAKRCTKCGEEKPFGDFHRKGRSHGVQRYRSTCRKCNADISRERGYDKTEARLANARSWKAQNTDRLQEYRQEHAEEAKAYGRKYQRSAKYGITEAVGLELRSRPCDICGRAPDDGPTHIDHCHVTGAVRGALCLWCNTALGKFQDSPELLARAIWYLTRGADYRAVDREA